MTVDRFFGHHLYTYDSDEDNQFEEKLPIDQMRALFLEYGEGLSYVDQ